MTNNAASVPPLEVSRFDDPNVIKEAKTEDYALHAVPLTWRNSRGSLAMAFYAVLSALFYVVVSATIALEVGSTHTIIGMVVASLVAGLVNFVISRYATRTGMTVALFSRSIFGHLGAAIATLIFAATAVYFAVFEGSVIAVVAHEYFGGVPLEVWYLVVVALTIPLIVGGVGSWLDKINGALLPFYCIGIVAAVVMAVVEYGYSNDWLTFEPASVTVSGPGWIYAFAIYMGVWIQMMFTMDYARYGRPKDAKFNSIVTFGPVFYLLTWLLNGLIGLFLIFTIPTEGELTETSGVLGIVGLLGLVGVIFVWASQTRINTANYYLASSNLQSFFSRVFKLELPRTTWLVIAGAIVYLMMLTDVFTYLSQALLVQGIFVVSWVGIALTQIGYEYRAGTVDSAEFRPGRVPMANPAGIVAWFCSSGVGIALLFGTESFGQTWAPIVAFVLAVALYGGGLLFARRTWFVLARPHDPRDEVDDPWEARVKCATCERSYIAYEMDRDPGAGHQPICAGCASASTSLLHDARREARASDPPRAGMSTGADERPGRG